MSRSLLMGIFNVFLKNKKPKVDSVEAISRKVFELKNEDVSKTRSKFDIEADIQNLYKKLADILFKAIDNKDLKTINKVLKTRFIDRNKLVNNDGYNIIDYSLFTDDNELFKYLYNNLYEELRSCFKDIPVLFTVILNRKNFELIEFFLIHDDLASSLKRENVTNCLFLALQSDRKDLSDLIVNNFNDLLDSRNIEASMIYSISHNQEKELKVLFSYPNLIEKFSSDNVEKMLAFSVLNQNIEALEIMVDNQHFIGAIEKADPNMMRSILQIAYDKGSVSIMNTFMNNNVLKNNVKDVLRIENK